ncbi:hypothetical protein DFH08DRAFT_823054 [Mycena albidolilacea]|uniref:Uncharacterized protein n=1 Tax=Mycena albidolilacea TaxID=1033008 RepID=A0AAD7ECI8_9AGAR|nr:hypothetical protein DFH08DRAFT_823054 [Mycena albidolilacea]
MSCWLIWLIESFGEGPTVNGNTRSYAHKNYNKVVEAVQATERHLSIEVRWTSEDKEWTDAAELVFNCRYRRVVDSLEALVVKRLLELTKDPTGSATIRAWADLAAHQLLDSHHKLNQAKQEIQRLNIEIRHVVTYMKDEREFFLTKEAKILPEGPTLAFFIGKYRRQHGQYDEIHMKCFYAIRQKLGSCFTADLKPGEQADPTSTSPSPRVMCTNRLPRVASYLSGIHVSDDKGSENGWLDGNSSSDNNEGEDAWGEELGEVMERVALLALDKQAE